MASHCASAEEHAVKTATRFFDSGEFVQGLTLLNRKIRNSQQPELKAVYLRAKAVFWEHYAGDLNAALRHHKQITRLDLPRAHPESAAAREEIRRIEGFLARHREELTLLSSVRVFTRRPEELRARVKKLLAFVGERRQDVFLAEAYHHLGATYLELGDCWRAWKAFEKALALKPALGCYQPTFARKTRAYEQWLLSFADKWVWHVLGVMLAAVVIVFCVARPWRSCTARQLVSLLLTGGLFALAALGASWALGQTTTLPADYVEPPVFFRTGFGGFGQKMLVTCFSYGLVGLIGTLILAASTARFKCRVAWRFTNVLAATVLFSCMMLLFHIRHGIKISDYGAPFVLKREDSRFPYLAAGTYLRLHDVRPFVLTEPRAFPDLNAGTMNEPVFRRWLTEQQKIMRAHPNPTAP